MCMVTVRRRLVGRMREHNIQRPSARPPPHVALESAHRPMKRSRDRPSKQLQPGPVGRNELLPLQSVDSDAVCIVIVRAIVISNYVWARVRAINLQVQRSKRVRERGE